MRVKVFRNTSATKRWGTGKLPVRQRLLWLGPVFVLIQARRR